MNKEIGLKRSILTLKCPRCRRGNLFNKGGLFRYRRILDMPKKCSNCGQVYEIEPGFWLGALWMSYPIVILIEVPFIFAAISSQTVNTWLLFSTMIIAFIVFYPLMLRLGRSIWIHISIRYSSK